MKKYEVSDLPLASYLSAVGYRLLGTRKEGRRTIFAFDTDSADCSIDEAALRYYNRDAQIDALTYAETMRNLKSIIYQDKGEQE